MPDADFICIPSMSLKVDIKIRAITPVSDHIYGAARCAISHQPDISLMFYETAKPAWRVFLESKC